MFLGFAVVVETNIFAFCRSSGARSGTPTRLARSASKELRIVEDKLYRDERWIGARIVHDLLYRS